MPKFRKTALIEARQFAPDIDYDEACAVIRWCNGQVSLQDPCGGFVIATLEDGPDAQVPHYVNPGDWVVRNPAGEFYAIKPDVFSATYEQVAA